MVNMLSWCSKLDMRPSHLLGWGLYCQLLVKPFFCRGWWKLCRSTVHLACIPRDVVPPSIVSLGPALKATLAVLCTFVVQPQAAALAIRREVDEDCLNRRRRKCESEFGSFHVRPHPNFTRTLRHASPPHRRHLPQKSDIGTPDVWM